MDVGNILKEENALANESLVGLSTIITVLKNNTDYPEPVPVSVIELEKKLALLAKLPFIYLPNDFFETLNEEKRQLQILNIPLKNKEESFKKIIRLINDNIPFLLVIQKEFLTKIKRLDDLFNEKEKQIEKAIADYAAKAAVGEHKDYFENQKILMARKATKWLWATIIFAAITLGIAIALPILRIFYLTGTHAIDQFTFISSKILIVGILLTATVWCGRNYKSMMHLMTINAQKSIALNTFRTFIDSAENQAIKDAIILETTKSIFSIPNTGYLDGETQSDSGLKIFELIKNVKPGRNG